MLHGDLSNDAGMTIGFRCVDFFVKFKDTSFTDKVLNTVLGKLRRAEVDPRVGDAIRYLYRQTEYNVDLVIENKDYTSALQKFLESYPFSRIVLIDKPTQISSRLLTGDLSYYIDDDEQRRGLVNSKFAMSLNDFFLDVLGR